MPYATILEKVLELSVPYTLPPPWDRIPAHTDAKRTRTSPRSLVQSLSADFPMCDLLASRIVVLDPAGVPVLSPKLRLPGTPVLGLRDAQGELIDILTPDGLVCADNRPSAFEVLRDPRVLGSLATLDEHPVLLVASDMQDVILFRSIGLPAALIDGFDYIGEADIDELCRCFGLTRWGDNKTEMESAPFPDSAARAGGDPVPPPQEVSASDPDPRPLIVLVGWTPWKLSFTEPEAYRTAFQQFARLDLANRLNTQRVFCWSPNPAQGTGVRLACEKGETADVLQALLASIDDHTCELVALLPPFESSAAPNATVASGDAEESDETEAPRGTEQLHDGLSWAYEQLVTAFQDQSGDAPRRREKAIADYRRIGQRDCVQPVLDEAAATADAYERYRNVILAHKIRRNLECAIQECEQMAGQQPPDAAASKARTVIENDLLKSLNEIIQCRPRSRFWPRGS